MMTTPPNSVRLIALGVAGVISGTILLVAGCGSPAGTAGAVAAKAASDIVAAATQPTAQKAIAAASAGATSNSNSSQGIWGRWVRDGNVFNSDGSIGTVQLCEWNFARNGSFRNQARAGVANTTFMKGTFKAVGGVLTLSVGKHQQIYDYQVKGSQLILANPQTHAVVILHRG